MRLLSESEQEKTAEEFLTEVRTTETPEKEENVLIADSDTENRGASNTREWETQKRERKLTEKGRIYQTETLDRKRHNAYSLLSKQIHKIRLSLETADLQTLEVERDQLDKLKDAFNDAQSAFDEILDTEEGKQLAYQWFDIRDREYTECRVKITEQIQALERKLYKKGSVKSGHSGKSLRSLNSSTSKGSRSLRLEAAAKSARLRAEMEFFERDNEIRRLQLMRDIAIASAEENAIKEILDEEIAAKQPENTAKQPENTAKGPEITAKPQEPESQLPEMKFKLDPSTPPFVPSFPALSKTPEGQNTVENKETLRELMTLQEKQTELSSMLIQQQRISHLPAKEPPFFTGDAFDYPAFVTAFDSIISANVLSNRDRLYFLEKYTKGKANDIVKGFLCLSSENAYDEARKLLDQRFGNPVHVAEAYKTRMRNWPQITDGDSNALQNFSDFLVRCKEAVKTVGSLAELDSTQTLRQMSAKLPSYSGVKWCRHAHETQTKSGERVSFCDFVKFVQKEADLANDPIFSPDALRREKRRPLERDQRSKGRNSGSTAGNSFATNASPDTSLRTSRRPAVSCLLCEKNHDLEKCPELKRKNLDQRRDFIASKGLCFGCLRKGHLAMSCQSRLCCDECGRMHPTVLHGPKPQRKQQRETKGSQKDSRNASAEKTEGPAKGADENASANAHANVCNSSGRSDGATTSMILPVILYHKNNPDVKVNVYALLDDGSDTTFVTNSALKQLGVQGPEISLTLNTMHGRAEIPVQRIEGLVAQSLDEATFIDLPKAYSRESIPSRRNQIPSPEIAGKWPHLEWLKCEIPPVKTDVEVGVLIGCNCPKALKPRKVVLGNDEDPYAVRTLLGWGIIGPVNPSNDLLVGEDDTSTCHRVVTCEIGGTRFDNRFVVDAQTKEVINPFAVRKMFELDFSERDQGQQAFSQDDRKFLEIAKKGIRLRFDGHYEIPLPKKDKNLVLPNNRAMAWNRLKPLKKKLESNQTYRSHYVEFMNNVIQNGYAEKVPQGTQSGESSKSVWYIPHHGVYHPKKPNKIRVVFDCSAQFEGESLNKHLLQGPDLTNNLTGVLCRFRREPVALMCDIEAMFHQVKVPEECRDLLRFLWWEDGDTSKEPQEYRMTVHLFGAASSPGCCNFALKATADDNEDTYGFEPAEFLRRDFYVDDGLKSVPSVEKAVVLVKSIKEMCQRGGFNLHKFTSNKKEVIQEIPVVDRAEDVKNLDLDRETLPMERALGVQWCIESDTFKFVIALKDRPCTRRGILSTVSSIFDPLGFVAPVLLEGKAILQELCRQNIGWDDPVPVEIQKRWLKWKSDIEGLKNVEISRCYKPENFGNVARAELHHFSDASFKGYGQCSYLRLINEDNKIHCSFVIGKARVTPLKSVTVPRLELTAAVVSVRVSEQLRRELDLNITSEVFWTDSRVVLGYIANDVKRFHVFVANRVQEIQEKSSVKQWRYVDTKSNPADDASRGVRPKEFSESKWITGPDFLWKDEAEWENFSTEAVVSPSEEDPEVKKAVSLATGASQSWSALEERLKYFSDWQRARKAVALCRRYVQKLKSKVAKGEQGVELAEPVSVQELSEAEAVILKSVQQETLPDISPSSPLSKLDTFIGSDGVTRVGGRLKLSSLPDGSKHPALLPKTSHVTDLIIRHYHQKVQHQGRGITANEIRASGYWIVGASTAVASVISKCIKCRKLRGAVQEQRMAELPDDRVEPAPPFSNCAVDYFGPLIIKEGRKELKRYGVLFTCMASRAIHIEVAATLETDSFISALRRFICRRGPIRQLRSDQGTNFVGARRELKEALDELNHVKIRSELQRHNCDWFVFNMNVPSASHMGGVWERQIRSVRNVLAALLQSNGSQLNEESLRTLLCEVEAIVNSRPLTVDSINDPLSLNPLTPNHLLTMKTKVVLPPPGVFQSADKYCRKRWRRVQHLANEFWARWKKEYLLSLQQRQRWTKPRRDMCVGDVVIIKDDDEPRNKWLLARVAETFQSADGHVRKVKVAVADRELDNSGKKVKSVKYLERPIQKLVLLQETET